VEYHHQVEEAFLLEGMVNHLVEVAYLLQCQVEVVIQFKEVSFLEVEE
jgi:hypothetical protein